MLSTASILSRGLYLTIKGLWDFLMAPHTTQHTQMSTSDASDMHQKNHYGLCRSGVGIYSIITDSRNQKQWCLMFYVALRLPTMNSSQPLTLFSCCLYFLFSNPSCKPNPVPLHLSLTFSARIDCFSWLWPYESMNHTSITFTYFMKILIVPQTISSKWTFSVDPFFFVT